MNHIFNMMIITICEILSSTDLQWFCVSHVLNCWYYTLIAWSVFNFDFEHEMKYGEIRYNLIISIQYIHYS